MEQDQKPEHDGRTLFPTLFKGYPFDGVKSKEIFPNRPAAGVVRKTGLTDILCDPEVYPGYQLNKKGKLTKAASNNFIMHRLLDYQQALSVAEQQLEDILTTDPFIPEDIGFKLIKMPAIKNQGGHKLFSKDQYSILRLDGYKWLITIGINPAFHITLPNQYIAIAFFIAIGAYDPAADPGETFDITDAMALIAEREKQVSQ